METKVIEGLVGAGEKVGHGLVGTGENVGLVGLGLISLMTLSPVINVGYVGRGFISLKNTLTKINLQTKNSYLMTFCPVIKLDIVDIGLVGLISLKLSIKKLSLK